MKKEIAFLFFACISLPGCNFFNLFHGGMGPEKDLEHVEREKQTADAMVDVTRDMAQNGVEPNGRNAIVANGLSTDLSRSLGAPQQKIDYQNDQEVRFLRGENQRKTQEFQIKQKQFEDKIASMANFATNMTVGGGIGGTLLVGALGFLWRNRNKMRTFAQAQVVGTSQLKATYDHARVQLTELHKTNPEAAFEGAMALLHRDAINPILRNGAEAVGGSTGLESMLTSLKDGIEQGLLNRPLIASEVLIHNNSQV